MIFVTHFLATFSKDKVDMSKPLFHNCLAFVKKDPLDLFILGVEPNLNAVFVFQLFALKFI